MLRLVQRAPRHPDESPIILGRSSPTSFGKARTDTIGRSNDLLAHGALGKMLPLGHDIPNLISQSLRQLINL